MSDQEYREKAIREYMSLVREEPGEITSVPKEYVTAEMVALVFDKAKQNADKRARLLEYLLRAAPTELLTDEICRMTVETASDVANVSIIENVLTYVPENYLTAAVIDVALEGVKRYRINQKAKNFDQHVGDDLDEKDLVQLSKFIPARLWRDELSAVCLEVVAKQSSHLQYIPAERLTQAMCDAATLDHHSAIKYVPDNFKTATMCERALEKDYAKTLALIPPHISSAKITEICLEQSRLGKGRFKDIPEHIKNEEMCLLAVRNNYMDHFVRDLDVIPEKFRSADIYFEWVKKNHGHFAKVPNDFKTKEMCDFVMEKSEYASGSFKHVPDKFKTPEMCMTAVKANIGNYDLLPEEARTQEIKDAAKAGGYIFAAPKVTAEQLAAPGGYQAALAAQLDSLPPEMREQVLKSMQGTQGSASELEPLKQKMRDIIAAKFPLALHDTIFNGYTAAPNAGDPEYWKTLIQGLGQ